MKKNIIFVLLSAGLTFTLLGLGACSSQETSSNSSANKTGVNNSKPFFARPGSGDTSKESQLNIPYRSLNTSKVVTTFGFASCNDQNKEQPFWKIILNENPDLFLMMGDNVYASAKADKPIVDQYIKLNKNEDYRNVREKIPFLAIWDDHDFGQNDGGSDNPEKDEARRLFLNYWGYLKPSLPKEQKALYHSRIVGNKKQRVQFIVLDTRWDRSPLVKNPDYNPEAKQENKIETKTAATALMTADTTLAQIASSDTTAASASKLLTSSTVVAASADKSAVQVSTSLPKIYLPTDDTKTRILSEEQWKWLDAELKKPAELRFLVSSIQVIANDHYFEKWGNFPHERARLLNLLQKNKTKNLVILSGDRHLAAISKMKNGANGELFEITASALNRPSRATEPEMDASYTAPSYLPINYGLAKINWAARSATFEIRDTQNKVQLSQIVKF